MREGSEGRVLRTYLVRHDILEDRDQVRLTSSRARSTGHASQVAQGQIHRTIQPQIRIVRGLETHVELLNGRVSYIHRKGVYSDQAVHLRHVKRGETRVLLAQTHRIAHLSDGLTAQAHRHTTPRLVLHDHHVQLVGDERRHAEHARQPVLLVQLFGLQFLQVNERLFDELLRFLEAARLDRVNYGEQKDKHAQVVHVHPVEVEHGVLGLHDRLLRGLVVQTLRQNVQVVLQVLESRLDALHLSALKKVSHLND